MIWKPGASRARVPSSVIMARNTAAMTGGTRARNRPPALARALPTGAVAGTGSWLTVKSQTTRTISIIVPFVVAFGVIGLVMSVVIVGNVVNGAVVSGYRRIGVLKSIGFTPAQVVAAYLAQVGIPALAGTLAGVVVGNLLSVPLLSQTATVYGVGRLLVPPSVDAGIPLLMCALVGLAALLPALRAGRLSAVAAIATGRAPRTGRGYAAHRLLGRLPLPRPVTIGLAPPFARPGRTAVTIAAILFGATAVIFAAGLNATLAKAASGESHAAAEQVQVVPAMQSGPGPGPGKRPPPAGPYRTVRAAVRAQHGTLHLVAEAMPMVSVSGLTQPVPAEAFRGDAACTGYDMINGRWYHAPGEVVVNTGFLTQTGKSVGDTVGLTFGGKQIAARIVGEAFDPQGGGQPALITSWQTLGGARAGLMVQQYDVGLRPGTDPGSYADALNHAFSSRFFASATANDPFYLALTALIGTFTLLLALAAGLGVLNTVVLATRDRVHDLGVVQGGRDDPAADDRHGRLLRRRRRAGWRRDRRPGERDPALVRGAGHGQRRGHRASGQLRQRLQPSRTRAPRPGRARHRDRRRPPPRQLGGTCKDGVCPVGGMTGMTWTS
jgi:putative ABC transport system permease protein